MDETNEQEYQELKIIYKEIIDGSSYSINHDVYIKHLTEFEYAELSRRKGISIKKYQNDGILCEKDRIQQLIELDQWNKDKEEEILQCEYIIIDNEKNIKSIIEVQRPFIQKIIDNNKKQRDELLAERKELIGLTAEELAERDNFYYLIFISIFKDKECKTHFFESPDIIEDEDVEKYSKVIQESYSKFRELNIKKIAALPFFLNSFTYCKDALHTFLGKPIINLTTNQILLFSFGTRNLNILTNSEGATPPEILPDTKLDTITNWYDQQYSIILGKRKAGK